MENSINTVYVKVDQNSRKIWNLCKIASLEKGFAFAGIFPSEDREEFVENMYVFGLLHSFVIILDKAKREIDWKNDMEQQKFMTSDKLEMNYENAIEWLNNL